MGARGKQSVLLVEDEAMIAMLVEDALVELGCRVQMEARLEQALQAAETGDFDLAILDLNLEGFSSYPVADVLHHRDVPMIFMTGYGTGGVTSDYERVPVLQKPFQMEDLENVVARALSTVS